MSVNHNKKPLRYFVVIIAILLPVLWITVNYVKQPSDLSQVQHDSEVAVGLNSEYQYTNLSISEIKEEIEKNYTVETHRANIEKIIQVKRDKYNKADIVERVAIERELALLQITNNYLFC